MPVKEHALVELLEYSGRVLLPRVQMVSLLVKKSKRGERGPLLRENDISLQIAATTTVEGGDRVLEALHERRDAARKEGDGQKNSRLGSAKFWKVWKVGCLTLHGRSQEASTSR